MNYKEQLLKQKEILEREGYTVAYICLYGSQNYNLDVNDEEYQSDIDMKAVVVPTLEELVSNSKPVSKSLNTEWGLCDVKDIRLYTQMLLKANPTYIETLFTEHYIVNEKFESEIEMMLDNADRLVSKLGCQFIRAIYGMMCEKEKALCHPYPSTAHKIEVYGYDGKQAHHILRLKYLMEDYFAESYDLFDSFIALDKHKPLLMDLKKNKPSLTYVQNLVESTMAEARTIRDNYLSSVDEGKLDYSIKQEYLKWSQNVIMKSIQKECVANVLIDFLEN